MKLIRLLECLIPNQGLYSRLEDPIIEDDSKKEVETKEENQNIVSENKEALLQIK